MTVASYQSTEHLQGGFFFECICHLIILIHRIKGTCKNYIILLKVSITDCGKLHSPHSQAFLFVPACGTNSCLVPGSTHSARFTHHFFYAISLHFLPFFPHIRVWYQARQKGHRSSQEFDPQMSCRDKVIKDFKIQWHNANENVA